jgi:hypothetical protein
MNKTAKKLLYWTPRILCILFAMFLSLFSLDVFDEGLSFWETILALLIHLIPVYVVVIVLIFAWRWEWVGAIIFFVLAAFYIIWAWGRFHWSAYVGISGPLFLIALLFLLNWIYKAQLKQRQ